jgi:hypothetical protein
MLIKLFLRLFFFIIIIILLVLKTLQKNNSRTTRALASSAHMKPMKTVVDEKTSDGSLSSQRIKIKTVLKYMVYAVCFVEEGSAARYLSYLSKSVSSATPQFVGPAWSETCKQFPGLSFTSTSNDDSAHPSCSFIVHGKSTKTKALSLYIYPPLRHKERFY